MMSVELAAEEWAAAGVVWKNEKWKKRILRIEQKATMNSAACIDAWRLSRTADLSGGNALFFFAVFCLHFFVALSLALQQKSRVKWRSLQFSASVRVEKSRVSSPSMRSKACNYALFTLPSSAVEECPKSLRHVRHFHWMMNSPSAGKFAGRCARQFDRQFDLHIFFFLYCLRNGIENHVENSY